MSDSRAAAALDRLPWLEDEPQRTPGAGSKTDLAGLMRWSVPALAAVAGGSYWLGTRSAPNDEISASGESAPIVFSEPLPEPQPAVVETPAVQAPAPAAEVRRGRTQNRGAVHATPVAEKPKAAAPKARYWPARSSASAAGRMVRIGTFESPQQAKQGWRGIVGIYPGMAQIPAVVVPKRSLRDGRNYYRLQMGTNSQAHSEVLCQWMRSIGQSCVVVGLPGAKS